MRMRKTKRLNIKKRMRIEIGYGYLISKLLDIEDVAISVQKKARNLTYKNKQQKGSKKRRISKHQRSQAYPDRLLSQQTKPLELHFLHPSSWQRKASGFDCVLEYLACEKVQEKTITRIDGKENVFRKCLGGWRKVKVLVVVFDSLERMMVKVKVQRGCSFCQVLKIWRNRRWIQDGNLPETSRLNL